MLVEVLFANGEGLSALLELNDEVGLVRARGPSEGEEAFWHGRGEEYWTWMDEDQRTARGLLEILAWRVGYHFYRILQGPDGSFVPDDQFDREYEKLLAEHGPAEYEYIFPKN